MVIFSTDSDTENECSSEAENSYSESSEDKVKLELCDMFRKLRGPGELFYRDLDFVLSWQDTKTWIKRYFYHISKSQIDKDRMGIEITWTNGEVESE